MQSSRTTSVLLLAGLGVALVTSLAVGSPTLRAWLTTLAFGVIAWFVLLPRGWFSSSDRRTRQILLVFIALRLVFPFVSQYVGDNADSFFTGGFDRNAYHQQGERILDEFAFNGQASSQREVPGTGAIDLAVAHNYQLTGPTLPAANQLWSLGATIGLLLFWYGTRHLVGQRRHAYTATVLLLPTLMFWNAGVGKEAPIVLGTGAVVVGLYFLTERAKLLRGLVYLGMGVTLTAFVRPHITVLLLVAACAGVALGGSTRTTGKVRRLVTLTTLAACIAVVIPVSLLLLDSSGEKSFFDAAYDQTELLATTYTPDSSAAGRSAFATTATRSPRQVPSAVVTVLFRPFPWEATTPFQMLAAIEAAAIAGMLGVGVWRLASRSARLRRSPAVVMAISFLVLFSAAFVSAGNFGLLVRQRMQAVQFLVLIIFAIQTVRQAPDTSIRENAEVAT